MKIYNLILFILLNLFIYGQYCPFLGPDQLLPCGVNSITLTADLSQCGPGGGNPNQTTNYAVTNIPYIIQTNTGTLIGLGDDAVSQPQNIGFTFCFFGNTYTQFYIGSNGWIGFSGGQMATFASSPIPSGAATTPKNCIMGPWQDWHPGIGGQIRYQTSGVAPCRKLTVSWIGVPMYSCTNLQGTFHIVIYESTNVIENHIQSKPNCLAWPFPNYGTAVQGIHNLAGNIGITIPGRNSTQWTAQNNSHRWTPSGPSVQPILTWFQVGNPVAIGTGPTITVTPPLNGANYTCQFIYPLCNQGWSTCNSLAGGLGPDTVFVQPGPPNLPPPNLILQDPYCNNGCDGQITVVPNGGTGITTISWNNGSINPTLSNLCSGTYNFNLIDQAGCTYSGFGTLLNPLPLQIPQISNINPICIGDCNGSATTTPIDGIAPYTYLWDNGQTTQTAINLCAGTYNVIITDVNGCPASNNITLNNPLPVLLGNITSLDTICYLSTNETYSVPNLGYTYNWTSIGSITTGQGTDNITVDWSALPAGLILGAVNVIAVNQDGCTSIQQTVDIYILNVLPTIDSIIPLCDYNDCITLIGNPIGGIFTGNGINGNLFCPFPSIAGNNIITYTYTQLNCTFDTTRLITVYPRPTISSIQNNLETLNSEFIELCEGDSIGRIYTVISSGNSNIIWVFNQDSIINPTLSIIWDNYGAFTLSAVAYENGCISYPISYLTTIQRCPEELIYIPNTFTPDGNEHNNIWLPIFTSGFDPADFHLIVYNRWGSQIFESYNSNFGWDGSYNNIMCQNGIYNWVIVYGYKNTDKKTLITGYINFLR